LLRDKARIKSSRGTAFVRPDADDCEHERAADVTAPDCPASIHLFSSREILVLENNSRQDQDGCN
jgi:hypothetical protein